MCRRIAITLAGLLLEGLLLAGCAVAPVTSTPFTAEPQADSPELAAHFGAPAEAPFGPERIFALSADMRNFLEGERALLMRQEDPRRALVDMLYRREKLALEYDTATTRTADQAFAARRGNCLSLVIMTATLARALGLPVHYQRVLIGDSWSRVGDLYVSSGHVNLALGTPARPRWISSYETTLIIDFLPGADLQGLRTQSLDESTVTAMFQNNRAAEALAAGALNDAYAWARAAVHSDPRFAPASTTLGVAYLRAGLAAAAQKAFETALRHDPDNVPALRNLALALDGQNRTAEAAAVRERLTRLEPTPPFYWFNAGVLAMRSGHYTEARDLFEREIRREAHYHEFHFWLAQAELALGHAGPAQRQLELARQSSTTEHDQALYAAKLDRLRQLTATSP